MTERTTTLDVQQFLNEQPFSPLQWRVLALCFGVVLLDGFDTGAVGFVAPSLIKEWGVSRPALAPVLSSALFGLAAGALVAGPLADRFGRKLMILVSVALFGAATLGAAFAWNLGALTGLRFVTGLGLGAAMPNAVTLTSELCPEQRRAALTNAMFCGFPLGASLGGVLAAWIIPHWGWRAVFALGGSVPLVLALLLALSLPESVRYLIANHKPSAQIRALLCRIGAVPEQVESFVLREAAPVTSSGGVQLVFSPAYVVGSIMLWIAYFMGLVIFYSLINWMPLLLRDAGMDPQASTLISALFPLGGLFAVLAGWLMDRWNANRVVAICYLLTALALYFVGQVVGQIGALVIMVLTAGTLMNVAQSSLPSLAAAFYPTQGRSTGVAWMMGIGRFGGIFGSFLVADLARRQLGFASIFAVIAVPGLIAGAALFVKQLVHPGVPARGALHEGELPSH
jgi:AAHS family 4-hydroxybenzoate transporter-like MFS transporter